MRTWSLALLDGRCGRCSEPITKGSPVLTITRPEQAWQLRRCPTCAGEPVPEGILERQAIVSEPMSSKPVMTRVDKLASDWRWRQVSETDR